jgi:hypothetical protein
MQAAFFKVPGIIPEKEAIDYMKKAAYKTYGKKGDKIVQMNYKAIDMGAEGIKEIQYPASWATATAGAELVKAPAEAGEFFAKVLYPIIEQKGDELPVSAFDPRGFFRPALRSTRSAASPSTCPGGFRRTASCATSAALSARTRRSARSSPSRRILKTPLRVTSQRMRGARRLRASSTVCSFRRWIAPAAATARTSARPRRRRSS